MPLALKALLLGLVEGLTEFLPISSTGHLILVGALIHFNDEKGKIFEIVIQTGAMLAIIWEYRAKFASVIQKLPTDAEARRFATRILIAFLPAALLGLLFGKAIKARLFAPIPVALAFIVGGFLILWVERRQKQATPEQIDQMTYRQALWIGVAQSLALIPGTSRSGATIIGGLLCGLSRRAATEFSFFLAVPTLMAAGIYDLYKHRALFAASDLGLLGIGSLTAFVSAFFCVRWLLRYLSRHDFTIFAVYRLVFGVIVLATAYFDWVSWSV